MLKHASHTLSSDLFSLQVVAVLESGANQGKQSEPAQSSQERSQPAETKPSLSRDDMEVAAYDKQDSAMRGHKAHIRFPPRRTPDGKVISAMPRWDQQKYIDRSIAASHPAGGSSREASKAEGSTSTSPVQSVIAARHPPRRTIPDAELEAIMLGGASP
jgi:hypothetical protein